MFIRNSYVYMTASMLNALNFLAEVRSTRANRTGPGVRNSHRSTGKTYRVPGGGKQECARRLRQIAAGQLTRANGLIV